jgi:hypothetical protein
MRSSILRAGSIVLLAAVSFGAGLGTGAIWYGENKTPARTHYESLDFSRAETAALGFARAYASGDFELMFLHLSPAAQFEAFGSLTAYRFTHLLPAFKTTLDVPASVMIRGGQTMEEVIACSG